MRFDQGLKQKMMIRGQVGVADEDDAEGCLFVGESSRHRPVQSVAVDKAVVERQDAENEVTVGVWCEPD